MATTKITDLTAYTDPVNTDVLPIVDVTSDVTKKVSIANVMKNASLGTNSLPGISFDGDPNTGIYSPGADQVAITTGGTARLTSSTTALSSTLPIDVPLGAQGTPSLTFTGDLNTGIYSPGADQVAISTGGSGRLFVDANGNVGIKTATPNNYTNYATLTLDALSGSEIDLQVNGTLSGSAWVSGSGYRIQSGTGLPLIFNTNGNSERLRITSAGLVGIGTSSPAKLLEVNEGDIQIRNSSTASLSTLLNYGLTFRATNQVGQDRGTIAEIKPYLGGNSDNDFGFQFRTQATTAGGVTTKMTLTPGGSLGIGSTSPGSALDVSLANNTYIYARENAINQTAGYQVVANGGTPTAVFSSNTATGEVRLGGIATNYFQTFYTNNTEKARLDASGRLLVGTSSVISNNFGGTAGLLQVAKNDYLPIGFFTYNNNAGETGYCPYVELNRARGTQASPTVVGSGDDLGLINFYGHDGTNFTRAATIKAVVDGTPGAGDMPGRLVFSTTADGASSPTERMRISQAGDVSIAKTSNDPTVGTGIVLGYAGGTAGALFCTKAETANTSTTLGVYSTGASAYRFYVGMGGTVYATSTTITGISDARLKENVRDLEDGLDKILQLQPRKFDWKVGKGKDTKDDRGFIAQEFEQVFPDLVEEWKDPAPEGEDPYKAVRADLIPVLVKAIQEQQAMIAELQAEVAALKAQ